MLTKMLQSLSLLIPASVVLGAAIGTPAPIVDLGYSIHQATINTTGSYYNFSNIRYGQAPVGPLRFSAPLPPTGRNATVNDGQQGVICPQSNPLWLVNQEKFLAAYLTGQNISNFTNPPSASSSSSPLSGVNLTSILTPSATTSEDCLFLDVIVPESIFDPCKKGRKHRPQSVDCKKGNPCEERGSKGAAVMVEIYGGGYTGGDKLSVGNPAGLISRSMDNGDEGVIYVAMNYRLGLFGWLSGDDNVTANAGLLDQRLALEWVQENIHLFGGDPSRVTIFGESAGGGSIMHHITSYGGKGVIPFQQAIPQSPGFLPYTPVSSKEVFSVVLGNASLIAQRNVSSANDLRNLSFEQLFTTNILTTALSVYGQFTYGPVVDPSPNSYVPDLPGRLIKEGKFHNVALLAGHNTDEGLLFTPPQIQTQAQYDEFLMTAFPTATQDQVTEVSTELYPPVFNGSYGYTNPIQRTALTASDLSFTCNAYWLRKYLCPSYGYLFSVPPGLHGEDTPYTFYNGDTSTSDDGLPVNATVAVTLQRYLTTFAMNGVPTGIELYDVAGNITNVGLTMLGAEVKDPAARSQCDFWQDAPYYIQGTS